MSDITQSMWATVGVELVRVNPSPIDGVITWVIYVNKDNCPNDRAVEDYEVWFADICAGTCRLSHKTQKFAVFSAWKKTPVQLALL